MAQNQIVQWWANQPTNAKTFAIAFIIGFIILAAGGGLYEYAKHGSQGRLDIAPANESVTCTDQATNPGFNFPITLKNPGTKSVYWSVVYVPRASTAPIRNFQHNRVRIVDAQGTLIVSGPLSNLNAIPAKGQTTITVLGYVDEAWSITFDYSGDPNAITPQVRTFSLMCS